MSAGAALRRDVSWQAVGTGLLAALIGYAGAVAVVIAGLSAVGASEGQIASGLFVLGTAMAVLTVVGSLRTRIPISVVWTTPGMALLATSGAPDGGYRAAVGAMALAGVLIALAGLVRPLGRWIAALPTALVSAMLAGVLLPLCLAPFTAVGETTGPALLVIGVWIVVGRVAPRWAVPAAVAVVLALVAGDASAADGGVAWEWPALDAVVPTLTPQAVVGIAVPLAVVTMASQNVVGLAILSAYGYRPPVGALLAATGAASALAAPFGAPTMNMAAVTGALCAAEEAHPDPARRYVAGIAAGLGHLGFALLAPVTAAFVTRADPVLVASAAGLALIGSLAGAAAGALRDERDRGPAVVTLLVTASGVTLAGIGSAFWGLVVGGLLLALARRSAPATSAADESPSRSLR